MEVKGPTQTRGTKIKLPETVGIKTKVTRTKITVTKTTKTATKGTPALGVTKVVAEGTKGITLEGVDTTRPTGITTRALALQTNKDKDKERQSSVRRIVGKGVLDTANYSEDFISFTMIDKLNAKHNCYTASKAITVCSGLDGQCCINNELNFILMTASVIPFH